MNKIEIFDKTQQVNLGKFAFKVGDTVKVHQKVKEGDKDRIQIFEGLVIAKKRGNEPNATFTVRKISFGVGVEKVLLLHSPLIAEIVVVRSAKVRRSKIYFIRTAKGKKARLKPGKSLEVVGTLAEIVVEDVSEPELVEAKTE